MEREKTKKKILSCKCKRKTSKMWLELQLFDFWELENRTTRNKLNERREKEEEKD